MSLFDGKVVAITGAGGGLGRAYAHAFAKEGAKVVVNDLGGTRDGSGSGSAMADQVVAEIKEMGGDAVSNYDSVATEEGANNIVKTAVDAFGRLDILVNNAGILRDKTLAKMTLELWEPVIQVHLKGTYLCGRAAAAQMVSQGEGGRIISTTSIAGMMGNFGQTNYAAAKAGIAGFTRAAAQELRAKKITVNAIGPIAKTRMTDDIDAVEDDAAPENIAPFILYLASEMGANITGRVFGVHSNHIFEYKMEMTRGVNKGDEVWGIPEIHDRFKEITKTAEDYAKEEAAKAAPAGGGAVDPATKALKVFEATTSAFMPAKAGSWEANLHFNMEGAGEFTMTVKDGKCTVEKGHNGDPTCVIEMSAETFFDMAEGKIEGPQAFMQGKITATNMKDMMKYGTVFDQKKSRAAVKEALAKFSGPVAAAAAEEPEKKEKPKPVGLNRDCLGKLYTCPPYFASAAHMLAYAHATNDENSWYVDEDREGGIIAPAVFPVRILHYLLEQALTDPDLNVDMVMLLFGEQDLRFHHPMKPGDLITTQGNISHIEAKSSGEVFDVTGAFVRDGETVCESTSRFFIRSRNGGKKKGGAKKEAPKLPDFLFEEPMTVRKDQTYDYAEASLDRNPIHIDDGVAEAAGLGGIILHGLCSMAFASQAVIKRAAGGDPNLLKRLKVRFARPVKPGETTTTQAWKTGETADTLELGFRVVNQDGVVVITGGIAEVAKS